MDRSIGPHDVDRSHAGGLKSIGTVRTEARSHERRSILSKTVDEGRSGGSRHSREAAEVNVQVGEDPVGVGEGTSVEKSIDLIV